MTDGATEGSVRVPRKRERTRALILETAQELLQDRDWEQIKIEDIAEDAGLVKTTIFNHFANKADLLLAVCDRVAQQVELAMSTVPRERGLRHQAKRAFIAGSITDNGLPIQLIDAAIGTLRSNHRIAVMLWSLKSGECIDDPLWTAVERMTAVMLGVVTETFPKHYTRKALEKLPSAEQLAAFLTLHVLREVAVEDSTVSVASRLYWQFVLIGSQMRG